MKKGLVITLIIFGLILISGGIYFLVVNPVGQSVLSVSSINVEGGKVYWTYYASANKPNENYIFTHNPQKYTTSDGTQVTPTEDLVVVINPKEKQCVYQLTKSSYSSKYPYYVLNNPSRVANIEIADGNNVIKTVNGATINQVVIKDIDGSGELVVETQGLLMGASDCPNYDNVAIFLDVENEIYYIGYKDEVDNWIDSSWLSKFILKQTRPQDNVAFTSSFTEIYVDENQLIGDINFGNPTFTITADSDYFDSTYYKEPLIADPLIKKINLLSEIQATESSSGTVVINNKGDEGLVNLQITSDILSVSGYSNNFILGSSEVVSFNLKAGSQDKCGVVNIEVCSVSQFSSTQNCDIDSKSICIIKESEEPNEDCGDGICQSNENVLTCVADCGVGEDSTLECKWYETKKTKKNIFGTTKTKCALSTWVYFLSFAIILSFILAFLIIRNRIIYGRRK